jgi:hypothetical protein
MARDVLNVYVGVTQLIRTPDCVLTGSQLVVGPKKKWLMSLPVASMTLALHVNVWYVDHLGIKDNCWISPIDRSHPITYPSKATCRARTLVYSVKGRWRRRCGAMRRSEPWLRIRAQGPRLAERMT